MRAMPLHPIRAMAGKSFGAFVLFLLVVAGIASFEMYALIAHNRERAAAVPSMPAPVPTTGAAGRLDGPSGKAIAGPRIASTVDPAALARWAAFTPRDAQPFYVLPGLSGIDLGGASELDTAYAPYLSPTIRAGFRVPILYLRMTKGAAADYAFDAIGTRRASVASAASATTRSTGCLPFARETAAGAGDAERRHLG